MKQLKQSLIELTILSEILDVGIEFNVLHSHLYEQHKKQKKIKILNLAETFVYNN